MIKISSEQYDAQQVAEMRSARETEENSLWTAIYLFMSNSKKKLPIHGNASNSDKIGKQKANRAFRRKIKVEIQKDEELFSELREISNVWSFPKDGKRYCHTIEYLKKVMRK